jgi:hypothetical protein
VPNCRDSELENVVSVMFKSFSKFVRYFNGNAKVKRIDFSRYGYSGCLRSLEITYSLKNREAGKEYHPHLHCIFALKKGLGLVKEKTNEFSLSYGVLSRRFSDLEILIQKIWYLLNNEKKVTLRNIDGMSVSGYSCNIDKIDENSYYEVFKYSMKVYDEDSNLMSYEQFKVLYDTLYIRRTIQGYGEFYGIQSDEIDESFSVIFDTLIEELRKAETPEKTSNFIGDIFEDMCSANAWTYISRKSIHNIPGEEITAFLNEPSSKERLDTALERLSLKKEKNRQEKQARIAEYIRHRFGGQIYINKRNEHCFKASGPKQLTIERILSERDLEEKITGLRTEYTLRSKKSWRGSLYHKNKIHEEQLS